MAFRLTKNPDISDLGICRSLDTDGGVELPHSLTNRGRDREFELAYKDKLRRHKLEITFSKVSTDMRRKGLIGDRRRLS